MEPESQGSNSGSQAEFLGRRCVTNSRFKTHTHSHTPEIYGDRKILTTGISVLTDLKKKCFEGVDTRTRSFPLSQPP